MLKNSDMAAGRVLKRQRGARLYSAIVQHLQTGGNVLLVTYTKATQYKPRHAAMFKVDKAGSVYVQSGKRWDCIDFTDVRFI